MLKPIEVNFKLDKTIKRALTTELMIKSHDINVVEFHISFDGLELTADHTVKVLSVFNDTGSQTNVNCDIADGKAIYRPDTSLISQFEYVQNYVYVYHGNQSLDVRLFTYSVGLSQIDKTALKVKEVYDQSYAELLADFEQALEDYKDSLPQADSVRAEVDVILDKFKTDSQAKLNQYDTDAQQAIADNQTAFNLAESNRQATYEQAEDSRNQASNQALVNWEQSADALLETVESNESARVDAETTRKTAETDRVSSETTRKSNETTRLSNESERESAEVIRLASEVERVNAENVRTEFYEGFDGRLDGLEADKVAINNLVTNGDFSQGTTGWEFGQADSALVVSDGVSKVGARWASYSPYYSITIDKNKKYFISSQIKDVDLTSSLRASYALTNGNSPINESQHMGSYFDEIDTEKFSRVSRVVTANNNYTSIALMKFASNSTVSRYAYFDDVIFVNLTDVFGAGNEPTKAEMDELINITGYFDEITLTQKQMLNWQLKLMRQNRNALIALGGTII